MPLSMGSPETHTHALAEDHDLLREYAEHSSENAFRALVERHSGMVYGVARRLVGDEHAAADITQSAFLALARKAASLPRSVHLAGWLHTAARYAASHWLRSEARRRDREKAASAEEIHAVNEESERTWDEISPWLDAALASLSARDREAVLLRYFEQRSFDEVATGLGTTEDAAKMRVSRAVRKLRAFLQRRGSVVNAAVLTTCLAGHAAATAPAHVVTATSQLAGSGAVQGAGIAALAAAIGETMRWARVKRILLSTSAIVAVVAGVGIGIASMQPASTATDATLATTWDLTEPGAVESLLRDSTVILGTWRATPAGMAVDEMPWTHLALRGPFAGDYRLQVAYTQQNAAGMVELLLPAGPQILLIVLRPAMRGAADGVSQTLDATLGPPPSQAIEHLTDVEVRTRGDQISLSVKLDGVEIAGTKDVPAAIQRAAMVPQQPSGALGLGAMRTGAIFTRIEVEPLRKEP
jgi:RNA polymerase sigma factor (sigma-70 family)